MTPRQHPAEGAENRTLAPTIVGATALDGSHALHEPANDSEEQIDPSQCQQRTLHVLHLVAFPSRAQKLDHIATT